MSVVFALAMSGTPLCGLLASTQEAVTPEAVTQEAVTPEAVLSLGPLGRLPPFVADPASREDAGFVPELDLRNLWPKGGDEYRGVGEVLRWYSMDLTGGAVNVPTSPAGPWYGFLYFETDRHGAVELDLKAAGAVRVELDGARVANRGRPDSESTAVSVTQGLHRGLHRLGLRVERAADRAPLAISLTAKGGQALRTTVDPRHMVTDYEELRDVVSISGLQLSPDGTMLARTTSRLKADRSGVRRVTEVRAIEGDRVLFSDSAGASALAWLPDSSRLLLRRGGSLFTWTASDGRVRQVLEDEPGLGPVSWSSDGSLLVFASTRGTDAPSEGGNQRRVELREKLSDWPTRPHLHVMNVASGARRRLSVPGDWVQDAFQLLADGRTLITLRNDPHDARPWFTSTVSRVDVFTAAAEEVAKLTMGFENRPGLSGMAVSPNGRWMAFVGPPSELGSLASIEVNAFDPDLFVMDLLDGSWRKVSGGLRASVDGHLHWKSDRELCFQGTAGSRNVLYTAVIDEQNCTVPLIPDAAQQSWPERIHDLSFAANGSLMCVGSDTDGLPKVYASAGPGSPASLVEAPNAALEERWVLPKPSEASYELEDGTKIEAWLYRPASAAPEGGWPVVVYYYGGASPTLRGWNELHHFVTANGYALLVMNPRGANGYGQPFADHHAGDWGEKASADILRGVQLTVDAHEDLDGERVGCYGGSYGGFMTMYLIAHSQQFAAAVSLYGISNLASYWGDGMWGWTYGDQAMAGRYPWTHPDWYVEQSPLFAADKVQTPLLLLHGQVDGNVPHNESEQMFAALRHLGVPCELVSFPSEDHGLRATWENRVAHRTMLVEWFDRWLKGEGEAWAARWE